VVVDVYVFDSVMTMMDVGRLVLLACVLSTMTTSDAAVIDDQSWNELERLDVCSGVDNSVVERCSLCPSAVPGMSIWRCCHDPRAFDACAAAVDRTLVNAADKRKTKFFLGRKRGTKFFLGKRSFGDGGNYASTEPLYDSSQPDKRAKYFLG